MSEEQFILDQEPSREETRTRPVFLTVLCILSWVGSGFAIVGSVISYYATRAAKSMLDAFQQMPSGDKQLDEQMLMVTDMVRYAELILAVGVGAALLEVFAVIMMWRLKRVGYYLYILSIIIAAIAPLFFIGTGSLVAGGLVSYFSYFISAVFIVMYGLNYKAMR
jgi:hypothetical protein